MEITPFMIYLIGIVDNVHIMGVLVAAISGLVAIFTTVGWLCVAEDEPKVSMSCFKVARISWIVIPVSIVLATMTPSSKTAAAMFVIPAIANNENVKKVASGIYDLAVEWMEELKPKSSKQTTTKTTNNKE